MLSGCSTEWSWPIRSVDLLRIEMSGLTVHPWLLLIGFAAIVGTLWVRSKIRGGKR